MRRVPRGWARVRAATVATALAACQQEPTPASDESATLAEARPPWQQIDRPSLAACGPCHLEVYREWSQSLHQHAWTNENVRAETNDFAQTGCRACHSPLPVLASGLDQRPRYRDFNQLDGVHCLSCHGLDDGVAAARTVVDAPCRPRYVEAFVSAQSCWPCHEPTHHAFEEYERSDAHAVGVRCVDCHMPQATNRAGRSHGPNGGLNPDFVRRAIGWECVRDGGEVRVTLRNRTGHRFPGEIPSRVFQLKLVVDGGEPQYVTLRKPGKTESRADDRLDVDETRVVRFVVDAAASGVQLQLLFKPFPLLPDAQAFLLGEWNAPVTR